MGATLDLGVADHADGVVDDLDRDDDVTDDLVALEDVVRGGEATLGQPTADLTGRVLGGQRRGDGAGGRKGREASADAVGAAARRGSRVQRVRNGLGDGLGADLALVAGEVGLAEGVPTALLSISMGTVTFASSGEAGVSGLTCSSAEAMPVPSINNPPVTNAVWSPRFAQDCMGFFSFISGSLSGLRRCRSRGTRGGGANAGAQKRTAVSRGSGADAKPSPGSGGVRRVGYPAEGGVQSGVTPGCEPGVSGMYRVPASA